MTDQNTVDKEKRAVFNLLWDMVNACDDEDNKTRGTIISRHASIIDDRIENSGNSRSADSLKLYSTEQLQSELSSRKAES